MLTAKRQVRFPTQWDNHTDAFGIVHFRAVLQNEVYVLQLRFRCFLAHCVRPLHRPVVRRTRTCSRKDRKSTRLISSHGYISYAVFCLKKKKKKKKKKDKKKKKRKKKKKKKKKRKK